MKRRTADVLPDGSKQAWMTASATVSVQLQANAAGRRTVTNTLVQVESHYSYHIHLIHCTIPQQHAVSNACIQWHYILHC
jgi:hypothetical protein